MRFENLLFRVTQALSPIEHALKRVDGLEVLEVRGRASEYSGFVEEASQVEVVSDSGSDNNVGSGLRKVLVQGLNQDWVPISEVVTLKGTTPAVTVNRFIRCNSIVGIEAGGQQKNAGNVRAYCDEGDFVTMLRGENEGYTLALSVPADKQAMLLDFHPAGVGPFQLLTREFKGLFRVRDKMDLSLGMRPSIDLTSIVLGPCSDVYIKGEEITGRLRYILIDGRLA